ncbi:MAG: YbaK/EbsC family protein [Clostridia bacterium]|nr:YbaK/EbsC family protein [Clostridia bacterium]
MSYEKVKEYFRQAGLEERVEVRRQIGDTVEHAAEAIGCLPRQIAKTMSFLVNGAPVLVVMAGDAKTDNAKFKAFFHEKAVMLPADQLEERVGHASGAVCPFAIREGVSVYLDISLRRFDVVYTAGGSVNSTVRLSVAELEKFASPSGWTDVGKGWQAEV